MTRSQPQPSPGPGPRPELLDAGVVHRCGRPGGGGRGVGVLAHRPRSSRPGAAPRTLDRRARFMPRSVGSREALGRRRVPQLGGRALMTFLGDGKDA